MKKRNKKCSCDCFFLKNVILTIIKNSPNITTKQIIEILNTDYQFIADSLATKPIDYSNIIKNNIDLLIIDDAIYANEKIDNHFTYIINSNKK